MTVPNLPAGFEALEPFTAAWAVPGADARLRRRLASTDAERTAFYAVAAPELPRAMAHLDGIAPGARTVADDRLLDLMLTLAQVSLAVERQREHEAAHAREHEHFTFIRTTADGGDDRGDR